MNKKPNQRHLQYGIVSSFLLLAPLSHAATTLVSTSKYLVNEGVAFAIGNSGASGFLFSWTDSSGAFSGVSDPTLVLEIGQTYTFQRTAAAHPFAIMDNSASTFIAGTDGSYSRTSSIAADITAAILTPTADFTASPAPTEDFITWIPTQVGDYWYTCTVASHLGMTGKITIVPEPSVFCLVAGGVAFAALRRRRGSDRSSGK